MDMDLDLDDLDFGDRVKDFLEHQLKEIKNNNASIEQKINERKQYYLKKSFQSKNVLKEKTDCSISIKWIKCFNKKYAVCFEVQNNLKQPLENIKPLLKWSSSKRLSYETSIYNLPEKIETEECTKEFCQNIANKIIKSNFLSFKGYIVIVINIPNYLENLEYTINCKILGNHGGQEVLVDLPNIQISAKDVTNREICVVGLSTGNMDDLLAATVTSDKTDLVFVFPSDWSISFDSTFEIQCSLTKINIANNCKKYFIANRVSPSFDDTFIAIHNSKSELLAWTTVFSSSNEALFSLLHHLHQHIPGLIIIPRELYELYEIKYCVTEESVIEVLQEFQKNVNKELESIESATENVGSKNIIKFRNKLTDLERDTDFLYLKICELNNFNMN